MENNIEEKLHQLRKTYITTKPSEQFMQNGWGELRSAIAAQPQTKKRGRFYFGHGLAFASMVLFFTASSLVLGVNASKASLPGDTLYPVKRLSEDVVSIISGDLTKKADERAKEIVKLAEQQEDAKKIEQTVKDYKEAIKKTELEASTSAKEEKKLKEKVEEHKQEFEKVLEKTKEKEHVKEAISVTKEIEEKKKQEEKKQGEEDKVKGIKQENQDSEAKKKESEKRSEERKVEKEEDD